MQPQIQSTLATTGSDTQPTSRVQFTETEVPMPLVAPATTANKPVPFWSGVIVAAILVLVVSAALAGIMFLLPPIH